MPAPIVQTVLCSVCHGVIVAGNSEHVSHSYCAPCLAIEMAKLDAEIAIEHAGLDVDLMLEAVR